MARRSRTSMVLAGLSLAGLSLLTPMGSASAATSPPEPTQEIQKGVNSQRALLAAVNCWTTISQPGGNGTAITVQYRNCGSASSRVTPNSHATAFDGSFTYVGSCMTVAPGYVGWWVVTPSQFPPADTTRWGVTNCI